MFATHELTVQDITLQTGTLWCRSISARSLQVLDHDNCFLEVVLRIQVRFHGRNTVWGLGSYRRKERLVKNRECDYWTKLRVERDKRKKQHRRVKNALPVGIVYLGNCSQTVILHQKVKVLLLCKSRWPTFCPFLLLPALARIVRLYSTSWERNQEVLHKKPSPFVFLQKSGRGIFRSLHDVMHPSSSQGS